jgi:23S rRNA maturation mini-RNase III
MSRHFNEMNEITLRLTDNEYKDYVKKGQSMYSKRMRRKITDEEYKKSVRF